MIKKQNRAYYIMSIEQGALLQCSEHALRSLEHHCVHYTVQFDFLILYIFFFIIYIHMLSSGGRIQILMDRGYETEFRGSIAVKGKGEMKTYFVVGKKGAVANNLSRQSSQISSLATVVYGMVQARRRQNTVKKRHFHRECASTNNTNNSITCFTIVLYLI